MPAIGMPYRSPASTLLVASNPARKLARATSSPASPPWARRRPNSTSRLPAAASTQRAARDAISVDRCTRLISAVSTICASSSWPCTSSTGSSGKNTVPSRIARTSASKRSRSSRSRNLGLKRPVVSR